MCAGGPPNPVDPIRPHSRATVSREGRSSTSGGGEKLAAGAFLEERHHLPVGKAGFAQLAVGLEARQEKKGDERVSLRDAGAEPPASGEVLDQPLELAPTVATLPVDEVPRRRVDRHDAVQLREHGALGGPERD